MGTKSSVNLESRRQSLTNLLSIDGTLRIEELADRFGVSTMTIRRDLQALDDQGVVRRVRGGAVSGAEPFEAREGRAGAAKQIIARKLVGLVPAGAVGICMDASSTISVLAGSLPHSENLSVVTDGVETFLTLHRDPRVHAYLTGGQKDPNAGSLVGPVATLTLRQFSFARAFLSAAAIDARFGTSEFSAEETEVKNLMAQLSDHVVMAVNSAKFETGSAARCLNWDQIDLMVTELDVTDKRLDPYRNLVELL